MNTRADADFETKMAAIDAEYEKHNLVKGFANIAAEKAALIKFRADQAVAMREYNTAIGRDYYIFDAAGNYVDIAP